MADGTYPIGSKLPSEAALCAEFGTSRGPVRQALETLRSEGRIAVSRGAAPRVIEVDAPSHPFHSLVSFTEWARSLGREPGQRTVSLARVKASTKAAAALRIDEGESVVEVLRLRSMDGVAMMVERSTFPLEVGRHLFDVDFDPDAGSIYQHLTDRGVDLFAGSHTIDAIGAQEVDADLLKVEVGSPLLRVRRTVSTRAGVPVEVADDRYLPGLAAVSITNTTDRHSSNLSIVSRPAV